MSQPTTTEFRGSGKIILWADEELLKALPLKEGFAPVGTWDPETRRTDYDRQKTTPDGVPIWRTPVFLDMGYTCKLQEIEVRVAAEKKPEVRRNVQALLRQAGLTPEELQELLGGVSRSGGAHGEKAGA